MIVVFLFCLMVVPASAQIIVLPTDDAYTDSAHPNTNYGNTRFLRLKKTDTHEQKVLLRFDLTQYASMLRDRAGNPENAKNILYQMILGLKPIVINHSGSILLTMAQNDFSEATVTHNNAPLGVPQAQAKIIVTAPAPVSPGASVLPIQPIFTDVTSILALIINNPSNLPENANRYVMELRAVDGLDMILRGKDVGSNVSSFSTGLELKPVSDGSFYNTPKIATIESKNTTQDASITANAKKNGFQDASILANNSSVNTNAGNISLNAGEISTNTNKNTAQDISIRTTSGSVMQLAPMVADLQGLAHVNGVTANANTTKNTQQDTDMGSTLIKVDTNTTKNTAQDISIDANSTKNKRLIAELGENTLTIRANADSIDSIKIKNTTQDTDIASSKTTSLNNRNLIDANRTVITNNHNSITAIKTKNTAQDTALANIQLTPGPQGIAGNNGSDGADSIVAGPTGPRGPAGGIGGGTCQMTENQLNRGCPSNSMLIKVVVVPGEGGGGGGLGSAVCRFFDGTATRTRCY